jgi:biopolymer transport protein TolR
MARIRRRKAIAEINVVPYIDVMLVLLIIFMVTAPLLTQGVQVNLPHAKAKAISAKVEPILVTVDRRGRYYLNLSAHPTKPLTERALKNLVAAALILDKKSHQLRRVMVSADKRVSYGRVMKAMVLCQNAGAPSVGLLTVPLKSSER